MKTQNSVVYLCQTMVFINDMVCIIDMVFSRKNLYRLKDNPDIKGLFSFLWTKLYLFRLISNFFEKKF